MASQINASNSGFGGIVSTGDSSGVLQLQTAGTTAVTIDTSQNVGIGVSTPQCLLDVQAGSSAAPTYTGLVRMGGHASQSLASKGGLEFVSSAYASGYGWRITGIDLGGGSNPFVFQNRTNSASWTERMRIDENGNVLVGKTSQIVDEKFGVDQTATSVPAIIARTASTASPSFKSIKVTNVSNSTQIHATFSYNNGGNGNGAIVGNGDSQAAFATFSDIRLKENIADLPSQLDKINSLRPVEFDYIKSGEHQIGFIAQEVKEIYPDLVCESEDGMLTVTGLAKTEARLIKAIQEQQTIINDLKARIETLEAK